MVMPFRLGLVAPLTGRLVDKVGPRPLTVGGMVLPGAMLVVLALVGVGFGLLSSAKQRRHHGCRAATPGWGRERSAQYDARDGDLARVALPGLVFSPYAGASLSGTHAMGHGFTAAVLTALGGSSELVTDPQPWRAGRLNDPPGDRKRCEGPVPRSSSTALAIPIAISSWPALLAAMVASKGSVTYSGSINAPGISLGVLK